MTAAPYAVLAAILAVDVGGSSHLMGEDEAGTAAGLIGSILTAEAATAIAFLPFWSNNA